MEGPRAAAAGGGDGLWARRRDTAGCGLWRILSGQWRWRGRHEVRQRWVVEAHLVAARAGLGLRQIRRQEPPEMELEGSADDVNEPP